MPRRLRPRLSESEIDVRVPAPRGPRRPLVLFVPFVLTALHTSQVYAAESDANSPAAPLDSPPAADPESSLIQEPISPDAGDPPTASDPGPATEPPQPAEQPPTEPATLNALPVEPSPAPEASSSDDQEKSSSDGLTSEPNNSWLTRLIPEVHGFVSQGFIKSTDNNYLANSEDGSFEFSEVGLNFTTRITDELRVGMQLFMRDLGPIGNYKPQFDWFYLDYRFFDWFGIRAGRTKIPYGLYNEVNDTPSARLPILLPQSLYPATARDYLLAQTGVELYGLVPLGVLGGLEYRAYGGTIYVPSTDQLLDIQVPYVVGGRLMWQTPLEGLVVGGTLQDLKLNGTIVLTPEQLQVYIDQGVLPVGAAPLVPLTVPVTLWVGSLQYNYRSLLLAAEYGRWIASYSTFDPPMTSPEVQSERLYGSAAWQWNAWLQTGAYYSLLYPDMSKREGAANQQHDVALTVRFDFNEHFLLKLEGHYMHGTAALDPRLNDGVPISNLVADWGVFLAKTTAYF